METKRLRIEEAIISHNNRVMAKNILKAVPQNKGTMTKAYLAARIWAGSQPKTQVVNMSNLTQGHSKTVKIEWIEIICKETGVDPNFLFGINSKL